MWIVLLIILILIVIGVAVWYFYFRTPTTTPPAPTRNIFPRGVMGKLTANRGPERVSDDSDPLARLPYSTVFHPYTYDEKQQVETEAKLLNYARAPPPRPEMVTRSNLRASGNVLMGDLPIKPNTTGIMVPYNADPDDLNKGYFAARR